MTKGEALRQLCKMVGETAGRLAYSKGVDMLPSPCLCNDPNGQPKEGEVADEIIEEMWRRLTDPRWSKEKNDDGRKQQEDGRQPQS